MLRFKKLDIFIAKQFGLLFVGTFFISLFVLMMQFLWRFVDDLIGKGLTIDVLAQFFGYMALMMVPQALPLAVLLSSLMTYGNLGESSELTAIKAAGISLFQSFRGLIGITILITLLSFYFQNNIAPVAQKHLYQLIISMKQKSPELEIPEGVFYSGIPQTNLYVEKKNLKTGHLYNIMVYRMTDSYEDQAIILADSGMLQSTAEKKHLVLNLWNGEWFENMRDQEIGNSSSVPYRRETFAHKKIVIDFNGDFSLTEVAGLSNDARTKSLAKIQHDKDSLIQVYDSVGKAYYKDMQKAYYPHPILKTAQQEKVRRIESSKHFNIDSLFAHLPTDKRRTVVDMALANVQQEVGELEFKSMITSDADKIIRQHTIEEINKFTLALTCLIFFFIGAPLGAIIRKGGLGLTIIVSVIVFIIFYILDNTGYKMSQQGAWAIWFGKGLSPAVLIPMALFFTYKANNDSMFFNADLYKNTLKRILGIRMKRNILRKEVLISDPDYHKDALTLKQINEDIARYHKDKRLTSPPNPIKVFFKYHADHKIEQLNALLEDIIDDLSNTKDRFILSELNKYPIIATKAHTRPFEKKWLNIVSALIIPLGIFFYLRMWRFRFRLYRNLKEITKVNNNIIERIQKSRS